MPGAAVIKKQRKAFKDSQTRRNMKNAKPRPQQKQKPKKKSFVSKIKDKIFGSSKAKASTIKRKDKPKKPMASDRQPGIKKANERKETSREANARAAGVTGKMPGAKDSQLMKAEKDRRARAKAKAAKKASDKKAADNRDAKRGGFISANAMKSSAKKANAKMAANKKRKSDELVSRGRK